MDSQTYRIDDKINPSKIIPIQYNPLYDNAYCVSYEFTQDLFANAASIRKDSRTIVQIAESSVAE